MACVEPASGLREASTGGRVPPTFEPQRVRDWRSGFPSVGHLLGIHPKRNGPGGLDRDRIAREPVLGDLSQAA